MAIGISPLVDFAFKLMLGDPKHSRVTLHFLNALLAPPRIMEVEFLNPFLGKETPDDKFAVLDVLARDELGRRLNIEMQTSLTPGLPQRLAYYSASLYADQLGESEPYVRLRPAITICVLEQALCPDLPQMHLEFRLREKSGRVLTDDLQVHLLELSKAAAVGDNWNISQASPAERWAYFLQYADSLTSAAVSHLFTDPEFVEADGVLAMISRTPDQRQLYDARAKILRDEASRLLGAREEGEAKGRMEGRVEGQIILMRELLGERPLTAEEFAAYDPSELQRQLESLRSRLRGER